ncbi:MAG: hypothetical protein SGBAC_002737 [Bacillariaceae sp.]
MAVRVKRRRTKQQIAFENLRLLALPTILFALGSIFRPWSSSSTEFALMERDLLEKQDDALASKTATGEASFATPTTTNKNNDILSSSATTGSNINFDQWIKSKFQAADPSEQEWCVKAFREGTFWKQEQKGSQFSQDVFVARRLFHKYIVDGKKGTFIEAGANHYKELSSSYFFEKCLGWSGLCVEPQKQYHQGLRENRSCQLVTSCLTKEKTQMMLGGMPAHRGAGMFVRPIPENGIIPANFERIDCAPIDSIITGHVDLFVLDVEGAEMTVLETIDWDKLQFGALLIETEKMNIATKSKLEKIMQSKGYRKLHDLRIDSLFVPSGLVTDDTNVWKPQGDFFHLSSG